MRMDQISRLLFWVLFLSSVPFATCASHDEEETRPLEHKDYADWKTVVAPMISNDGSWICFSAKPGKGDSLLQIRDNRSTQEFVVVRGRSARFSDDSRFVFYVVDPDPELLKKLKKEKKPASELPRPRLEWIELETGKKKTIEDVSSYVVPAKASGWLAYMRNDSKSNTDSRKVESAAKSSYLVTPLGLEKGVSQSPQGSGAKPEKQEPDPKSGKTKKRQKQSNLKTAASVNQRSTKIQKMGSPKPALPKNGSQPKATKKKKTSGTTCVLVHLQTQNEYRFSNVVKFQFSELANRLALTTSGDKPEDDGVHVFDLGSRQLQKVISGRGNYGSPVFDKPGHQLVFLTDRDDYEHKQPSWSVYHWVENQEKATRIIGPKTKGLPKDWWIASKVTPRFMDDGSGILLSTAPIPDDRDADKKTEDEETEKAKLDIWHWQDPFLQPQQLLLVEQERNRSYRACFQFQGSRFTQLATLEIPNVTVDPRATPSWVVGVSPNQYRKMRSWDYPGYNDFYLINFADGASRKIATRSRGTPSLSPAGKYVTWWDGDRRKWFCLPTAGLSEKQDSKNRPAERVDLGKGIPFPLHNELHDTPTAPSSYRSAGWLKDDKAFLIYDRWDVWQVDPTGEKPPVNLTGGFGRTHLTRLRVVNLDPEIRFIEDSQSIYFSALDHRSKASGYFRLSPGPDGELERLIWLDENLAGLRKAKKTNDVFLTRSTFRRCPDLWSSTLDFKSIQRVSRINPQQAGISWGSAELIHWKAKDGQPLDGILYKPDRFDPNRKYPMIVYFYERYSDRLHNYYTPAAGRSTINFSFYVSRGYV
ncbi:MAG: S9 family peptidase, partial [Planctomycetota bacterium]|nr:S9 family peptidase [Planctomycetota bacterium]